MLIPEGVTREDEFADPEREDAPNHAERWRELLAGGGVR